MSNWIDISQPLSQTLATYPGDTKFTYKLAHAKNDTNPANIGDITMCLHNGTHIDAPFHYDNNGMTIDQLPLDIFIGKALVLDVSKLDEINASNLQHFDLRGVTRILFHTALKNNPHRFPEKVPYLNPDIAPYFKKQGVQLLGVDLPSVDQIDSEKLPTHHALNQANIYILENLLLDSVSPGIYDFIAVPLRIEGADASPVRAIIRPIAF